MFQPQHVALARDSVAQRQRTQRIQGIRRGSRLIQLEIHRSRQAGHRQ